MSETPTMDFLTTFVFGLTRNGGGMSQAVVTIELPRKEAWYFIERINAEFGPYMATYGREDISPIGLGEVFWFRGVAFRIIERVGKNA